MVTSINLPDGVYQDQQAKEVDNADRLVLSFTEVPFNKLLRIENVTCILGCQTVSKALFQLIAGGEVLLLVPGATVQFEPPQLEFQIPLNNMVTFYVGSKPELVIFLPTDTVAAANCTITGQLIDAPPPPP